ncbi:MAG TPA: alanine dehydrogenase [Gammaproteobacteria bacterium]|nr:alanine dehydrogenase [Gammaproteobacteria bacterium]
MRIGVPKEIKNHEYRVGLTPDSVYDLTKAGFEVCVETMCAAQIGYLDEMYRKAGAVVLSSAKEVYDQADLIIKVKEPQKAEYGLIRKNQIIFTFLHLAADKPQAKGLMDSGCLAVAYEMVSDKLGGLPLLKPMSEVAGRISIQAGAHVLQKFNGGRGVLLGGVPGVKPGKVVIIGGGVVGSNALRMALGLEAEVTVLDLAMPTLELIDRSYYGRVRTLYANCSNIEKEVCGADLVVGAVLIPGRAAPKLLTDNQISKMKPGSVIVDVAIDQGGCFETSRPTSHENPTYVEHGVVHYCVTNMPGAVPLTSTQALNNATLPFVHLLAKYGREAIKSNQYLLAGLSVCDGQMTCPHAAQDLNLDYVAAKEAIE